ncbi:50S ribosomal protein L21 [Paracoccus aerodenitrificans]|uniref:50S ribosomal protein L21 n=1 Tax=Paracoccus aerodenitrificans TaxID=3017781 RepID=UPI0022EFEEE7|nr:50S ribosomal protein L21 [Paracoccus aerodenitrificans]WBU62849.1 50S ribosomal protein L21 [Paracoccus aerodenitrificans]
MFAVLKTGGKQYRVQAGDVLRVEKLAANAGDTVQFNEVLMVGSTVGSPLVEGAAVQAEVIDQIKADKVITYVKRRRKHSSQRTRGHRQQLTLLRVTDVLEKGGDKSGVKEAIGARTAGASYVAEEKPAAKKAAKPAKNDAKNDGAKKADAAADEAPKTVGTRPSNLLTAARDGGPDDLKEISGVGPKLEELLHENGVYHFDQIAEWKKAEIEYMDDQLAFHGRIERDEWIKQAKELAKGKKD